MAGIKQREAATFRNVTELEKKELRFQDFALAGFQGDAASQNKFLIDKAAERKRERELEELKAKMAADKKAK